FTYDAPPTVTEILPKVGLEEGGTEVTITGTNFTSGSTVKFGTTAATSVKFTSAPSLTATSPPGTGTVDVTVTTSGGTSTTSPADQFTYVPLPTITGIAPTSGPEAGGTSVTINGTNFDGTLNVKFGLNNAAGYIVNSAT